MPTATDANGAAPAEEARAARVIPRPMTPKVVKPVRIILDKPRTLRMDFEAMERFEDATGLSAWTADVWAGPRHLRPLIWAALLHESPDLTLDEVKSWKDIFHIANMSYLTDRLGELWGETMPEADIPATASDAGTEASDDPNPRRRAG